MSAFAAAPLGEALRFASAARTHPGKRRVINEDRLLSRDDLGFWAVADGMGGHQGGEAAASRLIEALAGVPYRASGYARLSDLTREVQLVNASLFEEAADSRGRSGSTLVAVIAHELHFACLWAGDSRAYLFREGALSCVSRDHSLVQDLVDVGALSERERRGHPNAHVITRAVGAAAKIELDQRFAPIQRQDRFLLCSDGLTACLDDEGLAAILSLEDLDQAADRLLEAALEQDASDNISLILVQASGR
jgi:serine/threonine protein phosphatase PrpC